MQEYMRAYGKCSQNISLLEIEIPEQQLLLLTSHFLLLTCYFAEHTTLGMTFNLIALLLFTSLLPLPANSGSHRANKAWMWSKRLGSDWLTNWASDSEEEGEASAGAGPGARSGEGAGTRPKQRDGGGEGNDDDDDDDAAGAVAAVAGTAVAVAVAEAV